MNTAVNAGTRHRKAPLRGARVRLRAPVVAGGQLGGGRVRRVNVGFEHVTEARMRSELINYMINNLFSM